MTGHAFLLAVLLAGALALAGCAKPGAGGDGAGPSSATDASSSALPGGSKPGSSTGAATPAPGGVPGTNGTADAAPNATARAWIALDQAAIRPGASLDDGSCTANFVFTSPDNATVYLGTAAHCFSESGNTETDGCQAALKPLGTKAKVQGAYAPGTLVYSSWTAMQAAGASGSICLNNDFALLRLGADDGNRTHPAMRQYGGPTGVATLDDVVPFTKILSYGNSGTRPTDSELSPREGYITLAAGGCEARVVFPNPAIPGDSGSPVILANGLAFGDFVSIELAPLPGQGHVCLLESLLAYAAGAGMPVQLATWELLDPGLLPAT